VTFIEKIKIAQAFAHLPLAFLGQGIPDDYESSGEDDADFYSTLDCWETNGGAAAWGEEPDTEPESQPEPSAASDPATPELTLFGNAHGPLTKQFTLDADGNLVKTEGGQMSGGAAMRIPVADVQALAKLIGTIKSNQALALGSMRGGLPEQVAVTTKTSLNGRTVPGTISRSREYMAFGERPGFCLGDFDRKGITAEVQDKLEQSGGFADALGTVIPELKNTGYVVRTSTSAGLFRTDTGFAFADSGGIHLYLQIKDVSDSNRFLETLHDRCWLAGFGWYWIGKTGQLLERSIIDKAVGTPEHLCFEGPPPLGPGLEQDQAARTPKAVDGGWLDTRAACPSLTPAEQQKVNELKAEAKRRIGPQAQKVRAEYVEKNAQELVERTGMSREAAIRQIESRCEGVLLPETVLQFADKDLEGCTVADVLADPKRFDHRVLADPIEGVSYGRTTAIVLLRRSDGHPWIKSYAHGDMSYTLEHGADAGVKLQDFYAYMPMHNYIFAPSREPWPMTSVNARIPPVVIGIDDEGEDITMTASVWIDKNQPVEMMTWAPGLPLIIADRLIAEGGWIERKGVSCFNLYRPPTIPLGDASKAGPWVGLVCKVYPDDADHIIKWLAQRRQHPEIKINHGLVLGSKEHGVGKDTILEGARRAVGPWNFKEVAPKNIFDDFNPWRRAVILRVNEAKDMGDVTRFELYDGMKTLLAAPPATMECNEKHIKQHYVLNCVGVVITTNHLTDGIYLPAEDRRHYVAWSNCKSTEFPPDFWNKMWRWYDEGGDRHVAAFLASVDLTDFDPNAAPPKTPAFWSIVNANRTAEEGELQDILDQLGTPDAVTIEQIKDKAPITGDKHDLWDWLKDRKNRKAINHRLENCGYCAVNNPVATDGMWRIGGRRQMVYAKSSLSLGAQQKAVETLQRKAAEEEKRRADMAAKMAKAAKRRAQKAEKKAKADGDLDQTLEELMKQKIKGNSAPG